MRIEIIESLSRIDLSAWNHVASKSNPFLQHQFLSALERHHCLEEYGWYPQHLAIFEDDALVAAMPMYIKDNSYGELVFDWAWADAYHRHGLPYTPATGPRLLVAPEHDYSNYADVLVQTAQKLASDLNMSSVHWLFTNQQDTAFLREQGMAMRLGCQFHWTNHGYSDFDQYLQAFSSQKRKQIKRERKRVAEQGISLEIRHGDEMNDSLWSIYRPHHAT